ncbi:MAG: hypothetical protein AAGI17_05870 [Planctomycetota bacterium]
MSERKAYPCATCSYDLVGQTVEGVCPECGDPVWRSAERKTVYQSKNLPLTVRVKEGQGRPTTVILNVLFPPAGWITSLWLLLEAFKVEQLARDESKREQRELRRAAMINRFVAVLSAVGGVVLWFIVFVIDSN